LACASEGACTRGRPSRDYAACRALTPAGIYRVPDTGAERMAA